MITIATYGKRILIGALLSGALLAGIAPAQTPIGTRIDNRAALSFTESGGGAPVVIPSNVASVVVTGTFKLGLAKKVSPSTAAPGDTLVYTIVASNTGAVPLSGVVVADTVPGSLSALSSTAGILNGNILVWNIGAMPAGGKDTVAVTASVRQGVLAGSTVTNNCYGKDTTGARIVAWADLTVGSAPKLDIRKSVSQSLVNEGDTLSYAIAITNSGNTTQTLVTLRDTLPAQVQYLSVSNGGLYVGGAVSWTRDSILVGREDSIIIRGIVRRPTAGGSIILNTAHAVSTQSSEKSASATAVVRVQPVLSFAKGVSPDTAATGDTVRYTLRFTNTGNVPLTHVSVHDTLPAAVAYISGPAGSQFLNGVYSFTRDSLFRSQADSVVVVTRVVAVGSVRFVVPNTAGIISDQTTFQSAQATFVCNPAQSSGPVVTFLKSGPSGAVAGDTVTYTMSFANHGPGKVTGVVIVDTLDQQLSFSGASLNGVYDALSHAITWQIPVVDSGANLSCTAKVVLNDSIPQSTTVTNRAFVRSTEVAALGSQVQTLVLRPAQLEVTKVASSSQALAGDTLKYTIEVTNYSGTRGDSLVITDVLPNELEYLSAQPAAQFQSATATLIWRIDSLSTGARRQCTIVTRVKSLSQPGEHEFTNTALLQWKKGAQNAYLQAEGRASVQLVVPFLKITKQAIKRMVDVGDLALYSLVVTNLSSTTTAYDLTIVDNPPLGFTIVPGSTFRDSVKMADPVASGTNLHWRLADSLRPGASMHITYRLVVGAGALDGTGVNSARVIGVAPGNIAIESPVASDRVEIRAGVFTDRAVVIGKVFYDDNEDRVQEVGEEGLRGVELILEDGTRIITGDDGKYSLPEVAPGEHVIRLREETLPHGDELLLGFGEFANVPSSRFIRVSESGIARADFYVRRAKREPAQISQEIARVGAMSIRRTAEPKLIVFVRDETLAPINIKGTQFEAGKAILRPEAYPTLKAVADYAREFPNQNIAVAGHSDSKPIHTSAFPSNKELSQARAKAVRDYLVANEHIDSLRLTTIGFGETQPVAANATKSGRALNRRVELTMSSEGDPFEHYFKTVHMSVAIDYDGAASLSHIVVEDRLDSAYHVVPGSAMLDRRPIAMSGTDKNPRWILDSVGTTIHKMLTYDARIFSPHDASETILARTTARYTVADSTTPLNGSCTTTNVVSRRVRNKPMRFVLSGVLFDAGKATLKEEALNALKGADEVLNAYPHATATIGGYTDSRPIKTKEFPSNVALSHARAMAVLRTLSSNFLIDTTRLQAAGWGELKPVASNMSEEGRKANRRVEIDVHKEEMDDAVLREGLIDSSTAKGNVFQLRGEPVYDSTTRFWVGENWYTRVSVRFSAEKGTLVSVLTDTLPAEIALQPNAIRLLRGIDSTWSVDNVLFFRCTTDDSVHAYSYLAEVPGQESASEHYDHRITILRVTKHGVSTLERLEPLDIRRTSRERPR